VERPTIGRTEFQTSGARENPRLLRETAKEPERENAFEDLLQWGVRAEGLADG
jgi:hypothetical protein